MWSEWLAALPAMSVIDHLAVILVTISCANTALMWVFVPQFRQHGRLPIYYYYYQASSHKIIVSITFTVTMVLLTLMILPRVTADNNDGNRNNNLKAVSAHTFEPPDRCIKSSPATPFYSLWCHPPTLRPNSVRSDIMGLTCTAYLPRFRQSYTSIFTSCPSLSALLIECIAWERILQDCFDR